MYIAFTINNILMNREGPLREVEPGVYELPHKKRKMRKGEYIIFSLQDFAFVEIIPSELFREKYEISKTRLKILITHQDDSIYEVKGGVVCNLKVE